MEQQENRRAQQTRERLRAAAHRLFLRQGYLATSIEAILAEAGIASKETLYRYYASKEALFADVLSHLTMEQPGFSERLAALPAPHDLPSLHQGLTLLAHEIVAMVSQPGYLPLVRMVIAESPRFPQLGALFFTTVTQRGMAHIMGLLQSASEQRLIANVDLEAVTQTLLGGLLASAVMRLVFADEALQQSPPFERADAVVAVIMRALTP